MPIEEGEVKSLQSVIGNFKKMRNASLNFVKLVVDSLQIVMFLDASIAIATGPKRQLEEAVFMVATIWKENIVYYWSSQCHHLTNLVMSADIRAFLHAFDQE